MNTIKRNKNLILIPIVCAILAAVVWSLYNLMERQAQVPTAAVVAPERPVVELYKQRLEEEGNRTARVEELIQEGLLSDKRASYVKQSKGLSQ